MSEEEKKKQVNSIPNGREKKKGTPVKHEPIYSDLLSLKILRRKEAHVQSLSLSLSPTFFLLSI